MDVNINGARKVFEIIFDSDGWNAMTITFSHRFLYDYKKPIHNQRTHHD